MFSAPGGKFDMARKIEIRSLDAGQGWIGGQTEIIRDHGCVGIERRHFAGERLQLRNLALEIRWLQSAPPPHADVHVAVQRANALRKAGEPLDQPRFFGEFLACPKRRLLDKTRIGRKSVPRCRDLDRERSIRRHGGVAYLGVEAFCGMVQAVTRRGQLPCRVVRLGCAGGRLQSAIQSFGNEPLVCGAVVEFEADVVEAHLVQPVVNNVEGGHFLGDEQNRLTVMHGRRDNIRDRLRFAGSRRTLDDKVAPGANGLDHPRLRGVRVDNMYEINGT